MTAQGAVAAAAAATGLPGVVVAILAVLVVLGEPQQPVAITRGHCCAIGPSRCPTASHRRRCQPPATRAPPAPRPASQCCCACCWAARVATWCCWWGPATRARPRCSTSSPRAAPTWAPSRRCSPTRPTARWPPRRCEQAPGAGAAGLSSPCSWQRRQCKSAIVQLSASTLAGSAPTPPAPAAAAARRAGQPAGRAPADAGGRPRPPARAGRGRPLGGPRRGRGVCRRLCGLHAAQDRGR